MSFFGGNTPEENKTGSTASTFNVKKTGKEIDGVVKSLLQAANDKDSGVKLAISIALKDIGLTETDLVVTTVMAFVTRTKQLNRDHRISALKILKAVLNESVQLVPRDTAADCAKFLVQQMTATTEVHKDLQAPCSDSLCLLMVHFPNIVVDELLGVFAPGKIPHYFVLKTLADCAVANGVGFTMRLKEVLQRIVPILGNIRPAATRWVVAAALGRFAEAKAVFESNATEADKKQMDTIDMGDAFQLIFTEPWIQNKEKSVRCAVAEALGHMSTCVARPTFEASQVKLIPYYLACFRKEKPAEHLSITRGLLLTLTESLKDGGASLMPLLQQVLQTLHPLVARPVDYNNPSTLKNNNELLRCFETLASALLPTVLNFVVSQFQLPKASSKLASLNILRHFVIALDDHLDDSKPLIMSTLTTLVGETSPSLKKAMMQLIMSMAHKGYMKLEGGEVLVKFIVAQASLASSPTDAKSGGGGDTGGDALASAGARILQVMAVKVESAGGVLFPYLLEFVNTRKYTPAVMVLLKCAGHLAELKTQQEAPDALINYDIHPDLPSPQALFARCLVLAANPKDTQFAITVVRSLTALGPNIHDGVAAVLEASVDALVEHIEATTPDTFNVNKWQDALLRLFKQCIEQVDDRKWLRNLCTALGDQYKLYPKNHAAIRVIHRYLGAVVARIEAKQLIQAMLDTMLSNIDHKSDVERGGLAQGLGFVGSTHLDTVLPRLTKLLAVIKKKGGFFGFGASEEGPPPSVQATAMLGYGYVTAYANPPGLMLSRLEAHVLTNLLPVIDTAKNSNLKVNLIKSIDLIAKAVHQSRLPEDKQSWTLSARDKLATGVIKLIKGNPSTELKILGVNAASTLANLSPPLNAELKTALFNQVFEYFALCDLAATTSSAAATAADTPSKKETKTSQSALVAVSEESVDKLVGNINTLLSTIVDMEPSLAAVTSILDLLGPWTKHASVAVRTQATSSYLVVISKYVRCLKAGNVETKVYEESKKFSNIGQYLATLLPRCGDSAIEVRQAAMEAIQALLYADQLLKNPANKKPSHEIKSISEIRKTLSEEGEALVSVLKDLAGLLQVIVLVDEAIVLMTHLISNLFDSDELAANSAIVVLNALVKYHGDEIPMALPLLVPAFVTVIALIPHVNVKQEAFSILRNLAHFHFDSVLDQLLNFEVPVAPEVLDCFSGLVQEDAKHGATIARKTLDCLLNALNETALKDKAPTPIVQTATVALSQVCQAGSFATGLVKETYSAAFCTVLMRLGTAQGVDDGASSDDAVALANAFFAATQDVAMLNFIADPQVAVDLKSDRFDNVITTLIAAWSPQHHADSARPVFDYLGHFLSAQSYAGQRIVATAIIAEFVNQATESDDPALVREIVRALLPRITDTVELVRRQALLGAGNLVTTWNNDATTQNAGPILSSLMSASEDQSSVVAGEAVHSLTRICDVVDEKTISPMLTNICFRMRSAFIREDPSVRAAAFTLFGALSRFGGSNPSEGEFGDQVHGNIPIYIVHMNDIEENVRVAALSSMRKLAAVLQNEALIAILAAEDDVPQDYYYDRFVERIVPVLLESYGSTRLRSYIDTTMSYYSSHWSILRANSVYATAMLLSKASQADKRKVNSSTVVEAMIKLLKQPHVNVRSKASKSLSLLAAI